jgi:hypothetical protein
MENAAAMSEGLDVYGTGARIAVIVANAVQFGNVRQFSTLISHAGVVMRAFYHEEEATVWLGRDRR